MFKPIPRFFFDAAGAKKKLGKKKRRLGNSATAVAASARALDRRKLLKKLDQNFIRQRPHIPINSYLSASLKNYDKTNGAE